MEKFNNMSRVIARDGDYYLVTNDQKATLHDMSSLAAIIKNDGTYITDLYPIDFFTREDDNNWESIDGYYGDYIKRKQQNVCMDCLLGFAIGDALGVPLEFLSRDEVRKLNIKEMVKAVHKAGGIIIIDAAQAMAHSHEKIVILILIVDGVH